MPRAVADVEYSGAAATSARRFAREVLRQWQLDHVTVEVELVVTELVTNAVLHGLPPISLQLTHDDHVLRVAVTDGSPSPPVPGRPGADAMTGRGLALVASLSSHWGVAAPQEAWGVAAPEEARGGAAPEEARGGKVVWAEVRTDVPGAVGDTSSGSTSSSVDVESLLSRWDDAEFARLLEAGGERHRVVLGDVPTDLLVAAKAHVDNVVRELTLAAYEAASDSSAAPGHLGAQLAELLRDVVTGFSEARQSIKRQALAAAARGDERTQLTLNVGPAMAEAGERYLAALDEVDEYARAARLLTVESPPAHRAFRHWYVQSLVDQLRAKARREAPPPPMTFERFLLGEVSSIALAHRISDRAARLQRVTAALAGAVTPSDVAHVTVSECVATLSASGGAMVLREEDRRLTVVGEIGLQWPRQLAPVTSPVDQVLAGGRAVWMETLGERAEPGVAALCAAPLAVGGQVIGALVLSFATAQLFDADDRAFVEAVAAEAAQTLSRTRLHEEQVQLAQRLARLRSVASDLAGSSGVTEVCHAAVRHALGAVGATVGALCLPTPDRTQLRIVEAIGGDAELIAQWQVFALDTDTPASRAYRTGRPVVVHPAGVRPDRSAEYADFPSIDRPLVCLPLQVEGEVGGVLSLSFASDRALTGAEVEFLVAFSDVCAQALARARALEQATLVSERFAFLAEASRQMASSLNYEVTLQTVADLAVPRLADWCGIDIVEGAEISPVAVAHVDPEKVAFARRFRALYPPSPDTSPVARVVATGESLLVADITDEMLVASAIDERHLAMTRELGLASVLMVPLRTGSRVVGALTLIRADALRPFTPGEVALAEDIGRRAGTAVENARLFREVQAAWHSESGTSHARLDLALEAASIGSFDWNLQTGSLTLDSRMRAIFGLDEETFDERVETVLAAILSQDRGAVDAAVERAIARTGDLSVEYRIRRPDGVVRWVDTRGRVLPGPDGRATRMIGIAFDSTEVREARDRVARTLEHMGDAFFSVDTDWQITYVNAAAERLFGRDRSSLLGRNVYEELPDVTGGGDDREYRRALDSQRPVSFETYIAETGRYFEVRVQPIPDGLGVYVADISQSRQFEQERAELRAASRHARSEAEIARSRLAFIAAASADITMTLDPSEVCRRLASHAVGRLADWVSVYVVENGVCHRVAAAHRDPKWAGVVDSLVGAFPIDVSSEAMVARAVRTGRLVLEQKMTAREIEQTYPDDDARAMVQDLGVSAALVTPMVASREVVGVMAFIRSEPESEFEPEEVQLAVTLAGRAALAVQNAQLYARQTTVAEALQRAVLPEALPAIDGVELAARYEPALGGAGVGGDFYDVFRLPSGRIALAVGDAAGHGLPAGALMGQLRNALRAYAVQERGPIETLRSLSDLIAGLEPDAFATAFYAELDPASGELTWASAGHPPPLLTCPTEKSIYLDGFSSPPLGIFTESDADGGSLLLPRGGGIFMYTDGLVERRGEDISDGLTKLQAVLGDPPAAAAAASVDAAVQAMRADSGYTDDVCVLFAVRWP